MRIRRCAARLLGSDYASSAPPPFQLPLPPPFEEVPLPTPTPAPAPAPAPPPPVLQPCSSAHAGGLSASSAEPPCGDNRSPWDLMAKLDPSDPKELEHFMEKYFVSVTYRPSWLIFPTSMPAARIRIKQEEEELDQEEVDMGVLDMVDYVNDMPWHKVAKRKKAAKRSFRENRDEEKYASQPKKKAKVKTEEDDWEDGMADNRGELWMCKKNDGKTWFCRRTVSQPDSYCLYHSDPKRVPQRPVSSAASKPSGSSKPRRRRNLDVGEGFYYYAGFGPSSRSKRQCRPSNSVMESPPSEEEEEDAPAEEEEEEAPAEEKEEAPAEEKEEAPAEEKEEAPAEEKEAPPKEKEEAPPKEHADLITAQPQVDDVDHQVASARIDEPDCDDTTGIAGYDEESSDDALCWNEPRVVGVNGGIKKKSPFKKRWRKPVKARSLKSLMT